MEAIDQIKAIVYQKLCEDHNILQDAFPTTEMPVKRNGSICAVMFCLHGPRAVKFTAIWEKDNNRVLFYGADGKRYRVDMLKSI
jgi:hypothetical protein